MIELIRQGLNRNRPLQRMWHERDLKDHYVESTVERLREASGSAHVTITDLTHGRGQFRLSGPRAVEVLHKSCALDFSDSAFPNLHAAQTGLAKVHALIVRLDESTPAYYLAVDRSLAAYVWEAVTGSAVGNGR